MPVGFHPQAQRELVEALAYYADADLDLAAAFAAEVERGTRLLTRFPSAGRPTSRILALRRFPCSLVYQPRESEILVLAVASQHRRPFYWATRTG
jgi:plasmid stabilization system protein ParE